jgi:hypothetical protein
MRASAKRAAYDPESEQNDRLLRPGDTADAESRGRARRTQAGHLGGQRRREVRGLAVVPGSVVADEQGHGWLASVRAVG